MEGMGAAKVPRGMPMAAQDSTADALRSACRSCSVKELCLPFGLEGPEVEELEGLVEHRGPLGKGGHLFRMDEECHSLFAIRAGVVKTYTLTPEGEEMVTGFFLAGDLVGFDGLARDRHQCNAKALDTTSYCRIPICQLDRLTAAVPGLNRQIRRFMGREIAQEDELLQALRHHGAETRVVGFLLRLAYRHRARHLDGYRLSLKIPNQDLANYLGLQPETLSRTFSRLQRQGLIRLHRKERLLELLDPDGLRARLPDSGGDLRRP